MIHMLSERSTCSPLSHASATVAKPSSSSRQGPGTASDGQLKRHRYHHSRPSRRSSSSSPQCHSSSSRRAPAAVPGTCAGIHEGSSRERSAGSIPASGLLDRHSHVDPVRRSWTSVSAGAGPMGLYLSTGWKGHREQTRPRWAVLFVLTAGVDQTGSRVPNCRSIIPVGD